TWQSPGKWDAAPEADEGRYGASAQDGRDEWHETRDDASRSEEPDPYRISGQDGRYDRPPEQGYDEGSGPGSQIDPFDPRHDRMGREADHEEQSSRLRRRGGILTIAAVLGLAVVGTAAAFGYRAWTGGSSPAGQPPLIK